MRKPPLHFSNEISHDTASRISSFGEAEEAFAVALPLGAVLPLGLVLPLGWVITLLAIDRTPSNEGLSAYRIGNRRYKVPQRRSTQPRAGSAAVQLVAILPGEYAMVAPSKRLLRPGGEGRLRGTNAECGL